MIDLELHRLAAGIGGIDAVEVERVATQRAAVCDHEAWHHGGVADAGHQREHLAERPAYRQQLQRALVDGVHEGGAAYVDDR